MSSTGILLTPKGQKNPPKKDTRDCAPARDNDCVVFIITLYLIVYYGNVVVDSRVLERSRKSGSYISNSTKFQKCVDLLWYNFHTPKNTSNCGTSPKSALWWSIIEAVSEDSGMDDEEQKPLDSIKSFHLSLRAVSL